jgi:hypothetical protein
MPWRICRLTEAFDSATACMVAVTCEIQGDADLAVAEQVAHDLGMHPFAEQQFGAATTQVMEADAGQAGPSKQREEASLPQIVRSSGPPTVWESPGPAPPSWPSAARAPGLGDGDGRPAPRAHRADMLLGEPGKEGHHERRHRRGGRFTLAERRAIH